MSQTYPYNQSDQAYPLNQLYQLFTNYVNQQVSSVSVQAISCTPQNVQATWQTCLADPVQLRAWIDTNQLTIDQVAAYLSNWWQTHVGKYVYAQQLNQDYYALPASYGVPIPPLLPWTDLINSNNMTLQAISGFFASQYLAYTSYMNLMGSGLPLAVNTTNWAGAIEYALPSYVFPYIPNIISTLGASNIGVTNVVMVINNPLIDVNRAAQIISYPTINITGMAVVITNPAVNITYMTYVLSSPAINYTNIAPIITVSAINVTTMAYIITSPAVNLTSIIYMYAEPTAQPAGIYYTLSNANVSATYAQSIYYSMASVAVTYATENNVIGFVTYNRPAVTLSANVSATWTLFYSSLSLDGYTLTMGTAGRPSVIVTYSIQMSGGAIVQQPTGAPGGSGPVGNYGGPGGGGLVIIATTGILDGLIVAVGSSGYSANATSYSSGGAGGSGYLIIIGGIVYTASTGGAGGSGTNCTYSAGGAGGGGYYGGPGGSGDYYGGPGGSVVSTLNYSTRWSYVYTMLKFLGDEWQRNVLGRTLLTYVGATYLAGYGSGGGGGGSFESSSASGGGGGMGGQIVIYMHNLYAPTANNIIAIGGIGGAAYGCGCGGGGGAGGLVYVLTHNLVAFLGTINVLGGIGMTGVNDSAGGSGTANTYAIFIV